MGKNNNFTRMCVVCRERKHKAEFARVVRYGGEFRIDESGNADGRGAYVCKTADCMDNMVKRRALNRTFKGNVPDEIYEEMVNVWRSQESAQ